LDFHAKAQFSRPNLTSGSRELVAATSSVTMSSLYRCCPGRGILERIGSVRARRHSSTDIRPLRLRPATASVPRSRSIHCDELSGGVGAAKAVAECTCTTPDALRPEPMGREGPILLDRPVQDPPPPRLIGFPVGPVVMWASAEPVRWVPGELLKFRPLDFGPR
jgi:hypothetical protein